VWNDVLRETIERSFTSAQHAMHTSGALEFDDAGLRKVLMGSDRGHAVSSFRGASLLEKERAKRSFRLPMVAKNPVQDEMVDTNSARPIAPNLAKGLAFDILLEEDLYSANERCLSQVRVFKLDEWDERVGAPQSNSLLDERMGPVRAKYVDGTRFPCPVCAGYNSTDQYVAEKAGQSGLCVGHFGHIQLPAAVWNPMMDAVVQHMLRSFCWHCGSLPGSDAQNARIVAAMYRNCETRVDKVTFLDGAYRDMKTCAQCAKHRRCAECGAKCAGGARCARVKDIEARCARAEPGRRCAGCAECPTAKYASCANLSAGKQCAEC
jgi:hypothetical protein